LAASREKFSSVTLRNRTEVIEQKIKNGKKINICSEYIFITHKWLLEKKIKAKVTEVTGSGEGYLVADMFDACVVITETGSTIKDNGLEIYDTIMVDKFGLYVSNNKLEEFERLLIK